jgi:hypothetical protein
MWQWKLIVPAVRKLKQKNHEFETSMGTYQDPVSKNK